MATTIPVPIRVMCVDDDPVSRVVVRAGLPQQQGFVLEMAETMSAAWSRLQRDDLPRIDVVLCDVVLPDGDGYVLCERLSHDDRCADIPVILVSAAFSVDGASPSSSSSSPPQTTPTSLTVDSGDQQQHHHHNQLQLQQQRRRPTAATMHATDFLSKPIAKDVLRRKVTLAAETTRQQHRLQTVEKQLTTLRGTVEEMNARSETLLETPLNAIVRRLRSLAEIGNDITEHGRQQLQHELGAVLLDLARSSLYGPAVERIATQPEVDPITRSLLLEHFSQRPTTPTIDDAMQSTSTTTTTTTSTTTSTSPPITRPIPSINGGDNEAVITKLRSWDFDAFGFNEEQLVDFVPVMFEALGLIKMFNINVTKLHAFAMAVRAMQHPEAKYHGWRHLFDCVQAVFVFLSSSSTSSLALPNIDILSLIVAALFHDVDHPGTTNSFQVAMASELAMEFNDQSVLENHHASTGFRLLRKPELNFLQALNRGEYTAMRQRVIELILWTDFQRHAAFVARWKALQLGRQQQQQQQQQPTTTTTMPDTVAAENEQKSAVLQLLIKAADVSNVARPWPVAKQWAERVCNEFWEQGKREREVGLPVAPHMDAEASTLAQVQIAFIDVSASLLLTFLADALPQTKNVLVELASNRNHWIQELAHH